MRGGVAWKLDKIFGIDRWEGGLYLLLEMLDLTSLPILGSGLIVFFVKIYYYINCRNEFTIKLQTF